MLVGCSYGGSPIGAAYHNTTARFNAYFYAKERMMEIEHSLLDKYQWNYNKILPVYIPIDSNDANSVKDLVEDCIKKASIAIQRHPESRWEDDSYILVGKARYYSLEYADAIETFKYVNKTGQDDDARHAALIELTKTFVNFNEFNNAIAVTDYLNREKLSEENQAEFAKVRAYMAHQQKDFTQMVKSLVQAEKLIGRSDERARLSFTIGQLYQRLGQDDDAYAYYKSTLKNRPEYELEFYTKVNMAQVTRLSNPGEAKKIARYFRKLLNDPKNQEYKDKIYYEMAGFELKQGDVEQAIAYYEESASASVNNNRQKAYSFLRLGEIYYDTLRNFELAQAYYDSTVALMPGDEENFEKVKKRQKVLAEFVLQLNIIRKNDSLIAMSQLSQDSLKILALATVEAQRAREEAQAREAERKQSNIRRNTANGTQKDFLVASNSKSTFYFDSPSDIARGIGEFRELWGNRELADDWRRSLRPGANLLISEEGEDLTPEQAELELQQQTEAEVNALLANIPQGTEQVDKLRGEVDTAMYRLGSIYKFQLEEPGNAIEVFESHLHRFGYSDYRPEVIYQLFLLYKSQGRLDLAQERAGLLKELYPETLFAKLVDNPNYREDNLKLTNQLQKVYASAYKLYQSGQYKASRYLLDSAIDNSPENSFSDNLKLLLVMNMGKMDGQYKYQFELNNFLQEYPESELVAYANKLLTTSEEYQINLYNSSRAKFGEYYDQKHILVVAYPNKGDLAQAVQEEVDGYIDEQNFRLTTGSLILDESYAMLLVNDFPASGSAKRFLSKMNAELDLPAKHKGEKIHVFVISEDNFGILYKTKDLNAYLNFFDRKYL